MIRPSAVGLLLRGATAILGFSRGVVAQPIVEFPVPTAASAPREITLGPDGAMWFTEQAGNKIGRIASDGTITEFPVPTAGSTPQGIAAGPDGRLWFTEGADSANKIGRITTSGVITEFPIPTPVTDPWAITSGPDGNLWFTEAIGNKIGRITTTGVITEFPVVSSGPGLTGITAGADGNVWFCESSAKKIGRITPSGDVTEFPLPAGSSSPQGIAAGPDGNLWFTELSRAKVGRITTEGVITEFPVSATWGRGITAATDGNLWFTLQNASKVDKVTVSGAVTEFTTPTGSSQPWGIAAAADGSLWFAEHGANQIGKLVPPLPPGIDAIAPTSGPSTGGTPISVAGIGFQPGATLTIGAPASNVVVVSDVEITANTPLRTPGSLTDVKVSNPDKSVAVLSKGWFADFLDVGQADPFHPYVETVFRNGITAGCGGGNYCRDNPVTRAQMAVFLLKAEHGSDHVPPPCAGVFGDVTCPGTYADWIEELASEGITGGCGGGDYCPNSSVTRQQMSAFLLKTEHGPAYVPPGCVGAFDDVACPSLFADWVEQLYAEQVTGGCSTIPPLYCPTNAVTRGQMAVFLVKTFGLP